MALITWEDFISGQKIPSCLRQGLGHKLSWKDDIIMVCGNPAMINTLEAIATAIGFKPKADFKTEDYWPIKA